MSISVFIITAIIILIMFGAGQRVLDRMRLSDRWALIILASIVVGIIIPPIKITSNFSFSIGGFLIPLWVAVYLMIKVGWSKDLLRAIVGSILTSVLIVLLQILMPANTPQDIIVDNTFIYGIIAGIVAYALGRSRRNAFICSVVGLTLSSVIVFIYNMIMGVPSELHLGVGGAFDTIVISTLIAVGLAELIGKTAEMMTKSENKVYNFEAGRFEEIEREPFNNGVIIEEIEGETTDEKDK